MASSDWCDHAHVPAARTSPAVPAEHLLWKLQKGTRTAEARVRQHPHGQELRFLVNGELLWSEVFKPGRGVALGEVAEVKRAEFEARRWRRVEIA